MTHQFSYMSSNYLADRDHAYCAHREGYEPQVFSGASLIRMRDSAAIQKASTFEIATNDHDFIEHHGIKGQRWGVITKEYEPVAVDHRRMGGISPVAKIRSKISERKTKDDTEIQRSSEDWENRIRSIQEKQKNIGKAVGAGSLALMFWGGYKLNKIHGEQFIHGKKVLRNLLGGPSSGFKKFLKDTGKAGMDLAWAKEATERMGMDRVKMHFERANVLLKGQRYIDYMRKAKGYINRFKNRSAG